jgi:ATP-dependent DNA helicase RecG
MDREKLIKDLMFHVRLGEDSSIEFKSLEFDGMRVVGPNQEKMAHELAAFANGKGGQLLLGVNARKHEVLGIDDDKISATEQWVMDINQNKIQPPVNINTCLIQLPDRHGNDRTVVYIEIPPSITVHCSAGRYYHRIGSTKQQIHPEVLAQLFQQRRQSGQDRTQQNSNRNPT